jgi:hypothetical protein
MTVGARKRSKYGNRKVDCLGEAFDSILERNRWLVLRDAEAKGLIHGLERQKSYTLTAHGHPICNYLADFDYRKDGKWITEDAKGVQTDVFRLKRKLFEAQTGRRLHLVTKATLSDLPE